MKQKLIEAFEKELAALAPQSSIKYLKEIGAKDMVELSIKSLYLYTRKSKGSKIALAETVVALGKEIRKSLAMRQDSGNSAKAGAFIIYCYELAGLLKIELSNGKRHATYFINVLDDDALNEIWEDVPTERTEKLPSPEPCAPWETSRHPTGAILVKTRSKEVLSKLNAKAYPIIFDAVNRAQKVGWRINADVLDVFDWALKHKAEAFSDIWEMESAEARASKIREAKAILSIAKRFKDSEFYHYTVVVKPCELRGQL